MKLEVSIKKSMKGFALDVQFQCTEECLGILGASGCGKSMTLKCIAGVERPDEGHIELDGKVLFDSRKGINLPPQKRGIGYLFQNYALFPTMTVAENIGAAVKKRVDRENEVKEQVRRFQLEGLEGRYPHQLSGGQQQRAAFARMMAAGPKSILMDEPFSALDGYMKDVLQREVKEHLAAFEGISVLVSHSRDEIYNLSADLLIMDDGRTVGRGKTKELFQNPGTRAAARLTGLKNFSEVEKINDHKVYAKDWHLTLQTKEYVDEDVKYAGVRGHHMVSVYEDKPENVLPVEVTGYTELPFETQYFVRNARHRESTPIWWMVPREDFTAVNLQGIPPYLYFPPEEVMLLK